MIMKLCDTTPIFYAVCGCKWKWRTNPPIHTHPQLPYLSRQLFEFAKALAAIVAEANEIVGVESTGTLPAQVDALLSIMGISSP